MEVVCNHFTEVCPSGIGQWHNSIVFSAMRPDSVWFSNSIYMCRWTRSVAADGQWREITFSFGRSHSRSGNFATEHYVQVGKELWILQHRTLSIRQRLYDTSCGAFYYVRFKLLRLLSCSRTALTNRSGVEVFDTNNSDGIRLHHLASTIVC